jgi:hypothetical protein
VNREQYADLAAAIEGRPDWQLDPFREWSQLNEPARYLPGNRGVWGQVFGPHRGQPDGWCWSVWHHHNPARGLHHGDPETTAADAVKAVEDLVAQVLAEHR